MCPGNSWFEQAPCQRLRRCSLEATTSHSTNIISFRRLVIISSLVAQAKARLIHSGSRGDYSIHIYPNKTDKNSHGETLAVLKQWATCDSVQGLKPNRTIKKINVAIEGTFTWKPWLKWAYLHWWKKVFGHLVHVCYCAENQSSVSKCSKFIVRTFTLLLHVQFTPGCFSNVPLPHVHCTRVQELQEFTFLILSYYQ